MLKMETNPGGLLIDAFDGLRTSVQADRSQSFINLSLPFHGYNRTGAIVSEGGRQPFWLQGMLAALSACYFCIRAFSEAELADLEEIRRADVDPRR